MLLEKERLDLIQYGKKMINDKLTHGTGGNLSIFSREDGIMLITPSGMDYFDIKKEDIVLIDVNTGKIVEGNKVPSSESDLHRIFYKYRKDINAVVHTHSKFATAVSCIDQNALPAINYLLASAGTIVPCAKYASYGTVELAKNAFNAMGENKAVLLSNHGVVACGNDIKEAYSIAETVEFCSEIYILAKSCGNVKTLNEEEMIFMQKRFKNYGLKIEEHDEI